MSHHARMPLAMVASRRVLPETRLVMSSDKPATKAGTAATSMGSSNSRTDLGTSRTASASPRRMAMPPMRGVGASWNFCTPKVLSSVRCPW
jgi:hypothetical protein